MTITRKENLEEKQLYGHFKRQTSENLDMTKARKRLERNWISSKSRTKNSIRTNYVKVKINKIQQNSKCN